MTDVPEDPVEWATQLLGMNGDVYLAFYLLGTALWALLLALKVYT